MKDNSVYIHGAMTDIRTPWKETFSTMALGRHPSGGAHGRAWVRRNSKPDWTSSAFGCEASSGKCTTPTCACLEGRGKIQRGQILVT